MIKRKLLEGTAIAVSGAVFGLAGTAAVMMETQNEAYMPELVREISNEVTGKEEGSVTFKKAENVKKVAEPAKKPKVQETDVMEAVEDTTTVFKENLVSHVSARITKVQTELQDHAKAEAEAEGYVYEAPAPAPEVQVENPVPEVPEVQEQESEPVPDPVVPEVQVQESELAPAPVIPEVQLQESTLAPEVPEVQMQESEPAPAPEVEYTSADSIVQPESGYEPAPVAAEESKPVEVEEVKPETPVAAEESKPVEVEEVKSETPVAEESKPAAEETKEQTLNEQIVESAKSLVGGGTDGLQCTEVVGLALEGAGLPNYVLWPDEYAGTVGDYTNNPQPGNLIYYDNGGRGLDHIAIYIGGDQAIHGNVMQGDGTSLTQQGSIYLQGYEDVPQPGQPQFIQVY